MKVILASTSPRRKELLKQIFPVFSVVSPSAEEAETGDPKTLAVENAVKKGRSVREECDVLLSCDTVVALDGKIYGKPKDDFDAVKMLTELSGKTHSVVSGVYLKINGKEVSFYEESFVKMKKMTHQEIVDYVRTYRPLDKAGAYGIQDETVVEGYEGEYENIVGLPIAKTRRAIERNL